MKAIILAAGIASRLRPLTNDTPKCLLKIGDKPLLHRTIDALCENGLRDIIIVTGYLRGMIESFVKSNYSDTINVTFLHNNIYDKTNNIYSLYLALKHLEQKGELNEFLMLDSDILFDSKIVARILNEYALTGHSVISLNSHELGDEEIKVTLQDDGSVKEISKVCPISQAVGESIGIELFGKGETPILWRALSKMVETEGLDNVFYEKCFERIIEQGTKLYIKDMSDLFAMELDTVEDFENAKALIPAELY